jgi:uncharacterized membrane protein
MNGTTVKFDLGQLLGKSWEVYKKNVGPLLGATVVMWVVVVVGMTVLSMIVKIGPLAASILLGPLQLGLFKMIRKALKDEPVDFNLLFSGFQRIPDAYLAGLVTGLFSGIGAVFCVIPGLIIATVYTCTYLFMNEKNLAFWDAMEASRKMAMNNPGQWVILALVLFGLNLVGSIPCGLGLLVTAPMTYIIIALAYDLEQNAVIDVAAAPVAPGDPPSA